MTDATKEAEQLIRDCVAEVGSVVERLVHCPPLADDFVVDVKHPNGNSTCYICHAAEYICADLRKWKLRQDQREGGNGV